VNPWEQLRRTEKAAALVSTIDREAERRGIATVTAEALSAWTPAHWAQLARIAKVNAPSPVTVELVISIYRRRAIEKRGAGFARITRDFARRSA
jgi:hypothetical protein